MADLPGFEIDPDPARARTLPAAVYREPAWYDRQRERVFARSWQLVVGSERCAGPGDVLPFTLLPGCLDEPLLLSRDDNGVLRCLSNVCTHRGKPVVECAGSLRSLRCPYHGRRFGLDGRMISMPAFEQTHDFPGERDHLPVVDHERWGPFSFVALDPELPFERWLTPVLERIGVHDPAAYRFDAASSRDYDVRANWALYCDNYLEGLHIPFVHRGLAAAIEFDAYRTELVGAASIQIAEAKAGEPSFDLPTGHVDHGRPVAAYYAFVFPNLMLNFYPWGLSVNVVEPQAVDRTRVRFLSWVADPSRRDHAASNDLDGVELEDEAIVESVQLGLRSRLYDRGRYSPTMESAVHHFHRAMAAALAAGGDR